MIVEIIRKNRSLAWIWAASLLFIAMNAFFIKREMFYFVLSPIIIFIILLAFVDVKKIIYLIVFFVPLSISLNYFTGKIPVDLHLPTEPLLAGVMILFFINYLRGSRIDLRILRHPVSLAIYFNMAWVFITSITSTDPVVSIKFFVVRLWFLITFYFLAAYLFQNLKNINKYIWMYVAAFSIVIVYTLVRHIGYGLDNQVMSHSVMKPFYKDHTSYGAVLALLIPVLLGLFSNIKKERTNLRVFMMLLIGLFVMAIIFSYTRAAWLGLIVAGGLWLVIILKIPFRYVTIGALVVLGLFFSLRTQILMNLEKNRQQSSGNITEHVQSMTNVRNDQSNLERINRWSCAIRMWKEKPVFGFGPGTYQFEYARFQRSYEKTLISTNFGTRGNAHSEYLGPLAESGLLGMLSILIVLATTIMTGLRVYYKSKNKAVKRLALAILLALISYYVHGFMNNFLDTDKVSALFWGFTAMLVAMDLYHKKEVIND